MAGSSRREDYGLALDIGTTDIKGCLVDLGSGKELSRASVPNGQKAFGQDVITRLYFATKEKGLKELNRRVISAVNRLIGRLSKDSSLDPGRIKKIAAVGNSTMYHLMLMIGPESLARAPFLPAESKLQERDAGEMGLAAKNADFTFLPNISGFVGSDILASILASGMHKAAGMNLIMDMGTNGEIALGSGERIFVASCASGPAFEGRHIKCGMPAREGAIIGARPSKKGIALKILGDVPPKGIGGSGLIDIIAILLNNKVIADSGRMVKKEFVIYKKKGKRIYVDQNDVRQVQLAKAALASGIEVLSRKAGKALREIKSFYVTGTFGTGIDKASAKRIGLIPKEVPAGRIRFLKDGALSGAKEFLLRPSRRREIDSILSRCVHVGLHKEKDFEELFTAAMYFG